MREEIVVAFRAGSEQWKLQAWGEAKKGVHMSITPVQPSKEQQMFSAIQSVAEETVNSRLNSVGKAPRVQFHKEPSRHFWVYRPQHPKLRPDVQLADDLKSIHFATSSSAECRFHLRTFAGGEVQLFNGPNRILIEEAASLILASFFQ